MANFLKTLFDKKPRVHKVDVARRFELLARVGQGSMSKVWRARDVMTGRMLAIKVLDKVKTDRFEGRFLGLNKPSEGEIAASLQHPNIVKTIEFGTTTTDEQYLVMDFIEGLSLSYLVDVQNEQMKESRLRYVIQLGEAVSYLHRQNWIHRDLCPRNVMIDPDNMVKLIDFGLVVPNTPDFQKPGNRTGTANYMAPELIKRQKTDQRIDVFSYAVTCYEMYSKRLPWDVTAHESLDTVLQHINKPPTPIHELAPDIPPQVAETIMKGMLSNPNERWQTIDEMLVPLRKAHAQIEAQKAMERKRKAAAERVRSAETPEKAEPVEQDDDNFFAQIVLGEGTTRSDKPKTKPAAPTSLKASRGRQPPDASKPASTSPLRTTKAGTKTADPTSSKPAKSVPPPMSSAADNEPDIVVEDEFDGIEVEEPADEFDGIEIEETEAAEGALPELPADYTGSGRSLAPLFVEDDGKPSTLGIDHNSLGNDEHDETVLRLHDDEDDDVIPGIEIDEEAPASRPSQKPGAGK